MFGLFSKLAVIIETLILVLFPGISSTPVSTPEPVVGVEDASSPTPMASSAPKVEDIIFQLQELKKEIAAYTPEPTPTPQVIKEIIYITPTPTPEPLDTTPPKVFIEKMVQSWLSNDFMIKNGGAIYGVMGLWIDSVYQDPQPSSGIAKIEYYTDGILIASANPTPYFDPKVAWDTTQHTDGQHELSIKAYDKAGNVATGSAFVTVDNHKSSQ